MLHLVLFLNLLLSFYGGELLSSDSNTADDTPVSMVMAGLSHGHSHWVFQDHFGSGIDLVGVYEPNEDLVRQFTDQYNLDPDLFFSDLTEMLDDLQPEGLLAFGSIYDHLKAVEAAAPRGIHIMVEKPLAVSMDHAKRMNELADTYGVYVLTNYETSWYPSTEKTYQLLTQHKEDFGELRKAVFHHGHQGPKEIGVGPEFLEWLIDPKLNGAGALTDFGCYGANIITYLKNGERPISVTAITATYKPEIYSQVDDDATIIVEYKDSKAIIQASWNWPYNRKDMIVYGEKGYIRSPNADQVKVRTASDSEEIGLQVTAPEMDIYIDPFQYFADVIQGKIDIEPYGLYSLENNMLVVEILEAAKTSAEKGEKVYIN